MSVVHHHPSDELLLDLASGAQARALALVVAGHLTFCPTCRSEVRLLEALGGELLRDLEPRQVSGALLEACLARLDEPATSGQPAPSAPGSAIPPVLEPYLDRDLPDLAWQSVGGFFDEVKLPPLSTGYRVSLLRVAPGRYVPEHGHEGNEFMLVLQGGYRSGGHHYQVGDFSACDGSEEHTPIAHQGEDCICLLVLDGPLAFRGADGLRIGPLLAM